MDAIESIDPADMRKTFRYAAAVWSRVLLLKASRLKIC
jgi:hypothetical protein